jgi:small subunit ribosomal protein S18
MPRESTASKRSASPASGKPEAESSSEGAPRAGRSGPRVFGRPFFQRRKSCPFSGPRALEIDYKDTKMLSRFISEYGKIMPSHITGVSTKKQRELTRAIQRARSLALLPYTTR